MADLILNYVLGPGHIAVPETDMKAWGRWMADHEADRRVALDEPSPGIRVSTVFLGLDHNHIGQGPPLLFETMVFNDYDDCGTWRYSTWDEAVAGHARVLEELVANA